MGTTKPVAPAQDVPAETIAELPVINAAPEVFTDPNGTVVNGEIGIELSEQTKSMIVQLAVTFGQGAKASFYTLADYIRAMRPTVPVPANEGAMHQRELCNIILAILKDGGDTYRLRLTILLAILAEYNDTVFSANYIGRFWTNQDAETKLNLVIYLIEVAPSATRATVVKKLRINHAVGKVLNEEQTNALRHYLRV